MTVPASIYRLACAAVLILGLTSLAAAQSSPQAPEAPGQKASARPDFAGTPAGPGGRGDEAQARAHEQGKKGQSAAEEKDEKDKAEKEKAAKAKQDKAKGPKAKADDLKKKGGKS